MHDKSRSIFCKVFIKSLGYWYFLRRYDIFAPEAYIQCFLSRIKRKTGTMEVIYYMRNYYPLTAAQKMHHNWIMDYGTQQVSGVSVVASVQAELDFGLLKKCIQMETERSGCTRVRFTKPDKDGNVKQYIEKQDPRDIELKDLSGMESLAKADELMQQWAYETFDGDNIPMCEFIMLKLPEGYNGFFLHMDHRLIDSCGLVVMIGDLFQLYTYYKYGTAYPQELADFETVLKKDLAKAGNEKRFAKDKKFWDDQLDALGEPLYSDIQGPSVLEEARKRHGCLLYTSPSPRDS